MKSAQIVIIAVPGVSLSIIQFLAVNGLGNGAKIPCDAPLTVQFLLSFLAQLVLGNKFGHDHHLLSPAHLQYNMAGNVKQERDQKNRSSYCPKLLYYRGTSFKKPYETLYYFLHQIIGE